MLKGGLEWRKENYFLKNLCLLNPPQFKGEEKWGSWASPRCFWLTFISSRFFSFPLIQWVGTSPHTLVFPTYSCPKGFNAMWLELKVTWWSKLILTNYHLNWLHNKMLILVSTYPASSLNFHTLSPYDGRLYIVTNLEFSFYSIHYHYLIISTLKL